MVNDVVVEISNSAVKILVGYVANNKPVILYATEKPNNGLVKNGEIKDIKSFADLIQDICHILDHDAKVDFTINKVILVYPSIGFEIYECTEDVSVMSSMQKIEQRDVTNLLSLLQKAKVRPENKIVDIIPKFYVIDRGRTESVPINMISSRLQVKAIIYTLPKKIVDSYHGCLDSADIKIDNQAIASHCIARLFMKDSNFPSNFIYVDAGADVTTVSLISKGCVYNSSFYLNGGNTLTNAIANAFSTTFKEAEKLKRQYGYSTRKIPFDPIIFSCKNKDDKVTSYTISQLNDIMKTYLDNYVYLFNNCVSEILNPYPADKRNFPIIVGGGHSRLIGFMEYFKEHCVIKDVRPIPLNVIGARHQKYLNCVGALLTRNEVYTGSLEDSRKSVVTLTRNSQVNRKQKPFKDIGDDVL